jgi:hypothetical protein
MRDRITVYYESTATATDMGGRTLTYSSYEVWADVNQLDSSAALRYGLNVLNESYKIVTRPPASGRPALVLYGTTTYKVISAITDKVGQYLTMIITEAR